MDDVDAEIRGSISFAEMMKVIKVRQKRLCNQLEIILVIFLLPIFLSINLTDISHLPFPLSGSL